MSALETIDLASLSEEDLCRTIRRVARQVREARGWTYEFVSQMLGMSVSEYQELESGEGLLELPTTLRLAFALYVPLEALLALVPVDLALIASQEKLIERIEETSRQLHSRSPEAQKAFLDGLEELFDRGPVSVSPSTNTPFQT